MITITHHNNTITVKGHAGYAPHGQDIVCASISALVQVFVASVEELSSDKLKCEISAGNAFIEYENLSEKSRTLLDSFFIGCRLIADSYPQYVRID
jgi:uncharacterized protein YsxB (DUF464 family)